MKLMNILSAARGREGRNRRNRNRTVTLVEALEGRRLLAASIVLNPTTQVLTVTGTDSADYVVVKEGNGQVSVTAYTNDVLTSQATFARSSIVKLVMDGKGGDDKLVAPTVTMSATLLGGSGNDALYGGTAADTFDGGAGDDLLYGSWGDDTYRFSGTAALGSDTIVEKYGQGVDVLDFTGFGRGVKVDLAVYGTAQAVAPGYLSLTFSTSGDANNVESMESVLGSNYADTIRGNARYSTLKGNGGNDVLEGRGGDDTLDGGAGEDVYVFGSGGNLGFDTVVDSAGRDTLDFGGYGQTVVIDLGRTDAQDVKSYFPDDDVNDGATRLKLKLPNSIEDVKGSQSKDWIKGNGLSNLLVGNGGNDVLEGMGGDDTLEGGLGDDVYRFTLAAGSTSSLGSDTIVEKAGQGIDTLDFVEFGFGATVDLAGSTAAQTVAAGRLSLKLAGTGADAEQLENVFGSNYADTIRGNARSNILKGNGGGDVLEGRAGDDRLEGGRGDDVYVFRGTSALGTDTVVEDDDSHGPAPDDHDKLDFGGFGAAVTVDLDTNSKQPVKSNVLALVLSSNSGVEDVTGTAFGDAIRGNSRKNTLRGEGGNDTIRGGSGDDLIYGGLGDDLLYGEEGADVIRGEGGKDRLSGGVDAAIDLLYGGSEADVFAIENYYDPISKTWKNRDRFLDFSASAGDTSI